VIFEHFLKVAQACMGLQFENNFQVSLELLQLSYQHARVNLQLMQTTFDFFVISLK